MLFICSHYVAKAAAGGEIARGRATPPTTQQLTRQVLPWGKAISSGGNRWRRKHPGDTVQLARLGLLRRAFCTRNRGLAGSGLSTRFDIFRSWLNRRCEAGSCRQGFASFSATTLRNSITCPHRGTPVAYLKLRTTESHKRDGSFARRFVSRKWAR